MISTRKLTRSSAVAIAAFGLFVGVAGAAAAAPDATTEPASTEVTSVEKTEATETDSAAENTADADATPVAKTAPGSSTGVVKAAAYSKLTISPAGPYNGGETVKITGSGFEANEQVVLSICLGGQKLAGPQDCAPLNGSGSAIGAANGSGVASLSIKVIKGKLGAQSDPSHVCGNGSGESCVFSLTNFGGDGPAAVRVTYKTAAASSGSGASAGTGGTSTGTSGGAATGGSTGSAAGTETGAAQGVGGAQLAATGGTAMSSSAAAAAFLVLGTFLVLVTRRERLES